MKVSLYKDILPALSALILKPIMVSSVTPFKVEYSVPVLESLSNVGKVLKTLTPEKVVAPEDEVIVTPLAWPVPCALPAPIRSTAIKVPCAAGKSVPIAVKIVLTVKLLDWPFGMMKHDSFPPVPQVANIVLVPVVPEEITNEPTCVEPSHKVISDKSETVVEAVALVNLRPSLVRAMSSLAAVKSIIPTVTVLPAEATALAAGLWAVLVVTVKVPLAVKLIVCPTESFSVGSMLCPEVTPVIVGVELLS